MEGGSLPVTMKARHSDVVTSQVESAEVTPPCSEEDSPREVTEEMSTCADLEEGQGDLQEVKDEVSPLTSPLPSGEGYELVDEFDAEEGGELTEEAEEAQEIVESEDIEETEVKEEEIKEEDIKEETTDGEEYLADSEAGPGEEVLEPTVVKKEPRPNKRKVARSGEELDTNDDCSAPVRKSSRLRTKVLLQSSAAGMVQPAAAAPTPNKQKMLQKPETRDRQADLRTQEEEEEEASKEEEKEESEGKKDGCSVTQGDPSKEPGADAQFRIDPDLLMPFRLGWLRECVTREVKNGPDQVEIYYYPPKSDKDNSTKKKEAVRRRRSKIDQERYFEEFPHRSLCVTNFSYVKRPLGLNNEAYEVIRETKINLETRATRASDKMKETKKSYREVAEHEGLLSSSGSEGEEVEDDIQEITEFDIGLPVTQQVLSRVTPLREEHKKRRRWPDRESCRTPPLAKDMPWSYLDDDPLGLHHVVYMRQCEDRVRCPATPPPLRALRLTAPTTIKELQDEKTSIRSGLPDPIERIQAGNKDLRGSENLASHDLAVRKFKNYRPPQILGQARPPPTVRRPLSSLGSGGPTGGSTAGSQGAHSHPPKQAGPPAPNSRGLAPPSPLQGSVKVRLPMPSTNGKRPVVELVMLTNGKYQPIKFTNNRQVTESIPKRLFDQANLMKKTLYQRSMQVPKIGTKQVFLAINPTPGGVRPYNSSPQQQQGRPGTAPPGVPPPSLAKVGGQPMGQALPRPVPQTSDQVSILVRPASGGNAVLLNVPRSVAAKVKQGTTLSFSASNDQKYTVIDNKMHPAVGRQKPPAPQTQSTNPTKPASAAAPSPAPAPAPAPAPPPGCIAQGYRQSPLPSLPSGVSIRPVAPGSSLANRKLQRPFGQPAVQQQQVRPRTAIGPTRNLPTSSPGVGARSEMFQFTPCSPFCPGVTGIPELECTQCHSLFHPKCVSIPGWQVASIQTTFKCKRCAGPVGKGAEIINLD